jgi:hypothetical protein
MKRTAETMHQADLGKEKIGAISSHRKMNGNTLTAACQPQLQHYHPNAIASKLELQQRKNK